MNNNLYWDLRMRLDALVRHMGKLEERIQKLEKENKKIKEILKQLISDSIRNLYLEKMEGKGDIDDLTEGIRDREELYERL